MQNIKKKYKLQYLENLEIWVFIIFSVMKRLFKKIIFSHSHEYGIMYIKIFL